MAVPAPPGIGGGNLPFAPEETFDQGELSSSMVQRIDMSVPMDAEERKLLGLHLRYEIDRYYAETLVRRGNSEQWRRDFELFPTGRGFRWPNSANVCAPLTHIYCQSHYTRLNQQIVKADPPFVCVARKPEVQTLIAGIQEAMESVIEEARWEETADQVHSELPQVGNCFVRVTYEEEWVRSPRFQYDLDIDRYVAMAQTGSPDLDSLFGSVKTDADGLPKVTLAWVDQLQHAGVRYKVVLWEDALVLPASSRDPKEAYGLGERMMIRGSELALGAKNGRYIPEAVERILKRQSAAQPQDRSDRLMVQGISPESGELTFSSNHGMPDPSYKEFLCYELCWQMDADGDGQQEWVIVTMEHETNEILRLQYMPYQHGRPYYVMFRYHTRARELFGMSVAEKLASIQDAATTVLNQILDHADLMLNFQGNYFYDGTSGHDPDKNPVLLGRPIKCDNVDGIKIITLPQLSGEHYNVYQLLKDQADLVTASSNPSLGKATDTTKTLGEVQIVAASSNMIFEEVASNVARSWGEVWDQTRWLTAQFGEKGKVQYRVSASPGHQVMVDGQAQPGAMVGGQLTPAPGGVAFGTIPAENLMSDVDMVPAGLAQLADMQARIQQATIVQNTLLMHPLTAQNLPALKIALNYFLLQMMYGPREQIMAEVEQWLMAQAAAAEMLPGLPGAEPGQSPEQQGPRGNPGSPPDMPAPPSPQSNVPAMSERAKGPPEGATAQHAGAY